jgi:hypothetical protein
MAASILTLSLVVGGIAAWTLRKPQAIEQTKNASLTFHRDIAPIIYRHCSPCHHPGEAAPFSLLNYSDVRKRARQIVEVTGRRIMPPWLPEPGSFAFEGDRSLSADEIDQIRRWVEQGTAEGSASESPALPRWKEGWQLGSPDLVVGMPEAYDVPAEGQDVYRNFVLPIRNGERRFVRAIELNPGNKVVVHHAFLLLDPSRESRRSDDAEPGPGFDGLHMPRSAQPPEGHFLSWQPGKRPTPVAEGMAWVLEKDSDLVLQMHLRPGGRPEKLQASVGFYFTNQPPSRTPFKIGMRSFTLDIPPGAEAHWVQDQLTIPVDVDVLSILPHAHYLGRELRALAMHPDGREVSLLTIPRWDFNWQGDYTYQEPVFLPKGSTIVMKYRYDNSTNNPANPNTPPQQVRYGLRSVDEMGELWLQVLPRNPADLPTLADSYRPRLWSEAVLYNQYLLRLNPRDARAHLEMGKARLGQNHLVEARSELETAAVLEAASDEPHYYLGLLFRVRKELDAARNAFRRAIELNPANAKAHGNLGLVAMELGATNEAAGEFREALRLNPNDEIARRNLERLAVPAIRKNP